MVIKPASCCLAQRGSLERFDTNYGLHSGELVVLIQNTDIQYNIPAFAKKISRKYNREGVDDRF